MENLPDESGTLSRQQVCFRSIVAFLEEHKVEYRTVHHEQTFTSEEAASARGVPLSSGGKSLLLKIDDGQYSYFSLFVMSASRKLNSKAIKKEFKTKGKSFKSIRFATTEELAQVTGGLVPGCVPPFGKPIFQYGDAYLDLYVDTSIGSKNLTIAFNAGSLTDSVIMSVQDYIRIAAPTGVFTFSKE